MAHSSRKILQRVQFSKYASSCFLSRSIFPRGLWRLAKKGRGSESDASVHVGQMVNCRLIIDILEDWRPYRFFEGQKKQKKWDTNGCTMKVSRFLKINYRQAFVNNAPLTSWPN